MKWFPSTDWGDDTSGGYVQIGQTETDQLIRMEFFYDTNDQGHDLGRIRIDEATETDWISLYDSDWIDYDECQKIARQLRADFYTTLMAILL